MSFSMMNKHGMGIVPQNSISLMLLEYYIRTHIYYIHAPVCACVCVFLITQYCPALCNPVDCSPPSFSVRRILWGKILEWVAIPFSRGSSWPRDWTRVSQFFIVWATREALSVLFQNFCVFTHAELCATSTSVDFRCVFKLLKKEWRVAQTT